MKKDISNLLLTIFEDKKTFLSLGFSQQEADIFYLLIKGVPIDTIARDLAISSYSIRQIKRRRFHLIPSLLQKKLSFLSEENLTSINEKLSDLEVCINNYLAFYKHFQNRELSVLHLSTRTINALKAGNIKNIQALTTVSRKELLLFKNLGRKAVIEIEIALAKLNLELKNHKSKTTTH